MPRLARVRPAAPEAGRGHVRRLRVAGPHRLGAGPRLDRGRLLHGPRRLHQPAAVLPRAAAAQPPHVLRLPAAPHDPGAHLLPDGRAAPPAQRARADAVLRQHGGVLLAGLPRVAGLRGAHRPAAQDRHLAEEQKWRLSVHRLIVLNKFKCKVTIKFKELVYQFFIFIFFDQKVKP